MVLHNSRPSQCFQVSYIPLGQLQKLTIGLLDKPDEHPIAKQHGSTVQLYPGKLHGLGAARCVTREEGDPFLFAAQKLETTKKASVPRKGRGRKQTAKGVIPESDHESLDGHAMGVDLEDPGELSFAEDDVEKGTSEKDLPQEPDALAAPAPVVAALLVDEAAPDAVHQVVAAVPESPPDPATPCGGLFQRGNLLFLQPDDNIPVGRWIGWGGADSAASLAVQCKLHTTGRTICQRSFSAPPSFFLKAQLATKTCC